MWKFIRRIFVDIIFVTILYIVSYTNHDSNSIYEVEHLNNLFLNTRNSTYDFAQMVSVNDYWKWLQMSFIPNIRVQPWYNNEQIINMTDYINDRANLLIGWATMRQLRVRLNDSCRVASVIRPFIHSCQKSYSMFDEEQRSFAPGWVVSNNVSSSYSTSIQNAFIYRTKAEFDSYIYFGEYATYASGGYVYEFLGNTDELLENISILHELSWIDESTRAVMIQLNLYNPNVNLYTSVTLLIEILTIGEIFPSWLFEPMQMYIQFNSSSSIFYLVIASIYMLFILYYTINEIYSIYQLKKKYFRQVHRYIEWGIIGCSWGGLVIYIYRYREAQRIGNYFHQTNGYQYINLQYATYLNNILTYLLGFCCFFGTIRLIRLFERYPRVSMFMRTIREALRDIASFSSMFAIVYFGFMMLFYFIFISKLQTCSTLLQTSEMLFGMLLLEFNFNQIQSADTYLGPFVFILFIYFVVFICVTMFTAIIMGHMRRVREEIRRRGNVDTHLMRFILRDLAKRVGWKRFMKEDENKRNDKTPMDQLSNKVEELLHAIEKIYGLQSIKPSTKSFHRKRKRIIYSN